MPNWCNNTLTLTHENTAMIERAKTAFANGTFLDEFIPVHKDLQDTVSGGFSDLREQAQLDSQTKANIEKHGYGNWYDFCVNEWGTKWDVGDSQGIQTWDDHELIVYFDSAWCPPIAAYEKLLDMGFTIYATYYEPGSAYAGIFEDGVDNYYDLSNMDSGDVEQQLPQELDEAYGISKSMAEWEKENEDEVTTWYKDGVEQTGLTPHEPPKKEL
ncbi:hypothetical protein UFOVP190_324 [uncultured Caudovirales phage]|uniref:YubB ferredoxin-like domain-containing protein n=1 Tax=uncultured Caudovirales phage TaxID=2100421 RepID=A0A6J7WME8_9CAUD|nr:hypothetical protein UFOVP190_324 [uncultured Caudovirales phage]